MYDIPDIYCRQDRMCMERQLIELQERKRYEERMCRELVLKEQVYNILESKTIQQEVPVFSRNKLLLLIGV